MLPMDNIFFRFLLQCWPIILAVIISVALIYNWFRPKVTVEQIQKGIIQQNVLSAIKEDGIGEDESIQEWFVACEELEKYLPNSKPQKRDWTQAINYRSYTNFSLLWTLFWTGTFTFIAVRIILNPYYYGNEAFFLGYFAYYIVIGLISYFRR